MPQSVQADEAASQAPADKREWVTPAVTVLEAGEAEGGDSFNGEGPGSFS